MQDGLRLGIEWLGHWFSQRLRIISHIHRSCENERAIVRATIAALLR
jgi:hypothetical protein